MIYPLFLVGPKIIRLVHENAGSAKTQRYKSFIPSYLGNYLDPFGKFFNVFKRGAFTTFGKFFNVFKRGAFTIEQANGLLVLDDLESKEHIEQCLEQLVDEKALTCTSLDERFVLSDPKIYDMEKDLNAWFSDAWEDNLHFDLTDQEWVDTLEDAAPSLNTAQRRAVVTALTHRIFLMSGGAGSGKTYTVNVIKEMYKSYGREVVLCAPTGKAAKRLEQVVNLEASTIHRLLGYDGRNFKHGPMTPIDADVIIIDEFSMVDIWLAWHLFRAIDLGRTAVVLVGDHCQLPPIGAGNILRDLVQTEAIPMVVLDHVVRQAGALKENSIALLKGEVRKTSPQDENGRFAWCLLDRFADTHKAHVFLAKLFEDTLEEKMNFDLLKDVQVLTPTHKGPLGTVELNAFLQRLIQKKCFGVTVPNLGLGRRPKFYQHDKVIQTRNNYDLGVMNGAMGFVTEVSPKGDLTVDFEGKKVTIGAGAPEQFDLRLGYALTFHKAQGSEYPCAIVIIHKSHAFMHHRNLFYTAVTRAKESVMILGDKWGIANCAARQVVDKRDTLLAYFLEETAHGQIA